ncbi:unnamed protein product [Linum trigynum]|uniref:Uncharacterized protein n=1 Tax=Linum trigynum TaxID=586398 RepID=A0AAV2FSM2_9ROSI
MVFVPNSLEKEALSSSRVALNSESHCCSWVEGFLRHLINPRFLLGHIVFSRLQLYCSGFHPFAPGYVDIRMMLMGSLSPSFVVFQDLGSSPRASICLGRQNEIKRLEGKTSSSTDI